MFLVCALTFISSARCVAGQRPSAYAKLTPDAPELDPPLIFSHRLTFLVTDSTSRKADIWGVKRDAHLSPTSNQSSGHQPFASSSARSSPS